MASYPYRTVIDAAALSRALVDASTVFAELGIASPTGEQTVQMETTILQVSGLVDRFLDRVLAEEDVTDHFRQMRGDTMRLSRYPVASILEVIEDGTTLTTDDWELDDATGRLWRQGSAGRTWWADCGTTTVSYVGGYILPDDLPADIQRAAVDQVKAMYFAGQRDPLIMREDVPDVIALSYAVPGGNAIGANLLLPGVRAALLPWRNPSL